MRKRIAVITAAVMIIQLLIPLGMVKYDDYREKALMEKGELFDFAVTYFEYSESDNTVYFGVETVLDERTGSYGRVMTKEDGQSYLCFTRTVSPGNSAYVKGYSSNALFPPDTFYMLGESFDDEAGSLLNSFERVNPGHFIYHPAYEDFWDETPDIHGSYAVTVRARVYRGDWMILGIHINGEPVEDFLNSLYNNN